MSTKPIPLGLAATPVPPQERRAMWEQRFSRDEFFYGREPGPLARRAVKYHTDRAPVGTALDVGCGEGQDAAFLAASGYRVTALDWVPAGLAKTRRLLDEAHLQAELVEADFARWQPPSSYDLVLVSNVLQFLAHNAIAMLSKARDAVAPGGILAVSMFAGRPAGLEGSLYLTTLTEIMELLEGWQPLEISQLWQWEAPGTASGIAMAPPPPPLEHTAPRAFVIVLARRPD